MTRRATQAEVDRLRADNNRQRRALEKIRQYWTDLRQDTLVSMAETIDNYFHASAMLKILEGAKPHSRSKKLPPTTE